MMGAFLRFQRRKALWRSGAGLQDQRSDAPPFSRDPRENAGSSTGELHY